MVRTQVPVGKLPPTFGHAEDEIEPTLRPCSFQHPQQTTRSEKLLHIAQHLAKIGGGVQDICRYDQIEPMRRESLRLWIALDIQKVIADERIRCELHLRSGGELGRDIREHIL